MALWPRRPLWSALKSYTKQQAPDATVPDTADAELTDLLLPTSAKADASWVGWDESPVQVDVDLGRARQVAFCQAWMLRRDADNIGQATSLTVYGSNNAVDWTNLGSVAPALGDNTAAWVEVACTTLGEWRYVRFEVVTASTWIYIGELQVYGFEGVFSTCQAGTADAGAGMEFLYHMNKPNAVDNEPDYSGNGRTLTAANAPAAGTGIIAGARRSYYDFMSRVLTCSATGNIAWGTAMTLMFFFKKQQATSAAGALRMAVFLNPGYSVVGWRAPVNNAFRWWVKLNNAAAAEILSPEVQTIADLTWYHFAMTYDGTTIRLYINGNLVGTKAYATAVTTSTYLRVGGDNNGYYLPEGWVDELLGFTRVLSEEEIRDHAYRRHGRVA